MEERPPPKLIWSASKDTNVSSTTAIRECYEPENKRKCTESEKESMERWLNGTKWYESELHKFWW